MATEIERNWTAHVVISSEHAGLKPYFKQLEDEMYRVLARVDDAQVAREYVRFLRYSSEKWEMANLSWLPRK